MDNIKTELKKVLSLEDLDITEKTTIKDVLNTYNSREDITIKEAVGNMSFENDGELTPSILKIKLTRGETWEDNTYTVNEFSFGGLGSTVIIETSYDNDDRVNHSLTFAIMLKEGQNIDEDNVYFVGLYDEQNSEEHTVTTGFLYTVNRSTGEVHFDLTLQSLYFYVWCNNSDDMTLSPGSWNGEVSCELRAESSDGTITYQPFIGSNSGASLVLNSILWDVGRNNNIILRDGGYFEIYNVSGEDYTIKAESVLVENLSMVKFFNLF